LSLQLRPAVPSDASSVAACVNAAYAHWVARIGRKPWPMLQDYAHTIQNEQVVVAEADGELVGVLVLRQTANVLFVDNVAVLPERQSQGVGRTLLVHAEEQARAHGHTSLYLYTNEKMTENIALYVRNGYVEYERREEEGFRRVFLRKQLR